MPEHRFRPPETRGGIAELEETIMKNDHYANRKGRRTTFSLAAGLLPLLFAAASSQPAAAQATYQYTGNPFTFFSCGLSPSGTGTLGCLNDPAPGNPLTSYTATDHVSATLTFDAPLGPNLNYQDVTSVSGFLLTMSDGHQNLSTASHPAGIIAKVSTDGSGQIIGPWLLVINVGNAADSGIATENEPPVAPFIADSGTLACCDPTIQGDLASNLNSPGTWTSGSPTPAQMVTNLITAVQGMNIPKQGTSLTDKLQQVENDINTQNGRACQDLKAFANQVKAQTGKTITANQASQILAAVAAIPAALSCGQ